jgi:hypothetical protein
MAAATGMSVQCFFNPRSGFFIFSLNNCEL